MQMNNEKTIPLLGLGTLRLCGEACISTIRKAIELGYRHIDTAPMYHNHQDVREGIAPFDRDKLFITSKYLPEQGCIETACDLALKELGMEYLDLYLIHWPDRAQPMEAILRTMEKLKAKGKILQFGVSNYTINHLKDMLDKGIKIPYNQVEFHPYLFQKELWDFCRKHQIQLISYRPLGKGELLTEPAFEKIGHKYQKTPAQVVLRWILQKNIPVLIKTSSEERLKENFSLFDFSLTPDEELLLDGLNRNKRFCVTKWADFNY
jgi:2,5-diketo-D-gluconate reductase B